LTFSHFLCSSILLIIVTNTCFLVLFYSTSTFPLLDLSAPCVPSGVSCTFGHWAFNFSKFQKYLGNKGVSRITLHTGEPGFVKIVTTLMTTLLSCRVYCSR
jgi:hypothetical protein